MLTNLVELCEQMLHNTINFVHFCYELSSLWSAGMQSLWSCPKSRLPGKVTTLSEGDIWLAALFIVMASMTGWCFFFSVTRSTHSDRNWRIEHPWLRVFPLKWYQTQYYIIFLSTDKYPELESQQVMYQRLKCIFFFPRMKLTSTADNSHVAVTQG